MSLKSLVVLSLFSILFYSCSKATSQPQYKYRKAVGDGIAAKAGDITISEKELYSGIETDLFEAEMKIFEIKFNRLNQLLVEKLIAKDPKAKGMTADQYFTKYISEKIKISDKDIEAFIKERKIDKAQVNDQLKERVKNYLALQKKDEALKSWIAEKTKKTGIEVYFQKPTRPTFDVKVGNAPTYGNKNAKVTIIEFSDFQCPFCAQGAKMLTKIKQKYGKKVLIAFKQYPLPFHSQAKKAAVAALCMNEQSVDLFWKMHDKMFADQSKLGVDALKETAKSLGADTEKFNTCLDQNKFIGQVEKDIQEGKEIGVKSTPTFYVNGQLIAGAQGIEVFSEIIDQELNK